MNFRENLICIPIVCVLVFLCLNIVFAGFLSCTPIQYSSLIVMISALLMILFFPEFLIRNANLNAMQKEKCKWLQRDIYVQVLMLFLSVIFYSLYAFKTYDFGFASNDAFPLLILSAGITGLYNWFKSYTISGSQLLNCQQITNIVVTILYGLVFSVIAVFFKEPVQEFYNALWAEHLFKYKYDYYSEIWFLHFMMTASAIFCISDTSIALAKSDTK